MANRRLKARRILAGLTQRELAEQVRLQEQDIGRMEQGRLCPSPSVKQAIADRLGVRTFELFDG